MLASVVALGATVDVVPSAGRGPSLVRAEKAARGAVLAHPSYRQIRSTRTGLLTRRCRHSSRAAVRCRLYTIVPSPCALTAGDPDTVCAQALWERRWVVRVVRTRGGTLRAHILKISAGPATGDVG
jgi:hypothetical protein